MTTLLVTMLPQSSGEIPGDQIISGLETGAGIAEFLSEGDFVKSLANIGKSIGPFLGALGPFMGLVLSFIPESESAELQYMKKMMKEIDNRFDRFDSRFNDVERLIDWTKVQVNFGQIEQKIMAMAKECEELYKVPPAARANRKDIFVDTYDSDYMNSGIKLYQALVEPGGTFQENLGVSVMRYTKNDRKKTQIFLLGTMQLLLQAAKIEISYLQARNFIHNVEYTKQEWEKRIVEVKNIFSDIDLKLVRNYHVQSGADIDEYATHNLKMINKEFSSGLHKMLAAKYYWRDWFVVIYEPTKGNIWDNHCVNSGGHIKLGQDGRSIVTASVDKKSAKIDKRAAQKKLESCNVYCTTRQAHCYGSNERFYNANCRPDRSAKDVCKSIPNVPRVKAKGAILMSARPYFTYDRKQWAARTTTHLSFGPKKPTLELYMWG